MTAEEYIQQKAGLVDSVRCGYYRETAQHKAAMSDENITPDEAYHCFAEATGTVLPDIGNFALFCREFSTVFSGRILYNQDEDKLPEKPRLVYFSNPISYRAAKRFSRLLLIDSAESMNNYRDLLEETNSDTADFAVLPIYSSGDGSLLTFNRQILRADLKIAATTDIETDEGAYTRFALVTKHLSALSRDSSERYLYISVLPDPRVSMGVFLSAIESLGARVEHISSEPLSGADDTRVYIHLDLMSADRDALYLFLEGARARYDTIGFYDKIN